MDQTNGHVTFRTASLCDNGQCVEVGSDKTHVYVRDRHGLVLKLSPNSWRKWIAELKRSTS